MKKFLILLISALCITTTTTIAQNQVRGVETKLVKYEGSSYVLKEKKSYTYSDKYVEHSFNSWFGYSFYNMNSIPVSVDAKLYLVGENKTTLVDTKSFVLESKESYVWKFEANYNFQVYRYDVHYLGEQFSEKIEPGSTYYIEYEAYKLE